MVLLVGTDNMFGNEIPPVDSVNGIAVNAGTLFTLSHCSYIYLCKYLSRKQFSTWECIALLSTIPNIKWVAAWCGRFWTICITNAPSSAGMTLLSFGIDQHIDSSTPIL